MKARRDMVGRATLNDSSLLLLPRRTRGRKRKLGKEGLQLKSEVLPSRLLEIGERPFTANRRRVVGEAQRNRKMIGV